MTKQNQILILTLGVFSIINTEMGVIGILPLIAAQYQVDISTAGLTLLWGILAGVGGNINQYWLVSAAPKAPDFANGLFLASTNLGTTLGAMLCGLLITDIGMNYVVVGGLLFALCSIAPILLRVRGGGALPLQEKAQEI